MQRAIKEARRSFAYREKYHIRHPDYERLEMIAAAYTRQDKKIAGLAALPQWQALAIQQYSVSFIAEYQRLVQEASCQQNTTKADTSRRGRAT